jgi:predicted Kef-type K+ transport protein
LIRAIALAFALLALTGCATMDGISFGLNLANAETTVSFRHGDGKTVLAAEQDGKTIKAHFRR